MSEWIAFEDRAPKVGQWVLVCRCGDIGWAENWPGISAGEDRVTHWQPFPDPPPKLDPFEEWIGLAEKDESIIKIGNDSKAMANQLLRQAFNAGFEAGRKEK